MHEIHYPQTFGELLRHFRVRAGYSQEELAERAAMSSKAISAIERGARQKSYPRTIAALANALNLSPEEREYFVSIQRRSTQPNASRPLVWARLGQ